MNYIKKKFENDMKTRINIIGSAETGKSRLEISLLKSGVLEGTYFSEENSKTIFSTEILCSSIRSNAVNVYLDIKESNQIIKELKKYILKCIDEAYLKVENKNLIDCLIDKNHKEKFQAVFIDEIKGSKEAALKRFFQVSSIEEVFSKVKLNELFDEIRKISNTNIEELLDVKDDFIWKNYFSHFQFELESKYSEWMKMISGVYADNEDGHEYLNECNNECDKYSNENLKDLEKMLYGTKSSCGLMIERAYIEAPASKEEYYSNVYIDYAAVNADGVSGKEVEMCIGKDYKEVFIILANCSEDMKHLSKFRDEINETTLNKRIFCIVNNFNSYKNMLLQDKNKIESEFINSLGSLVENVRYIISKKLGVSKDRIIVTEQFHDIDKVTLECLNTNNEFLNLLKIIKRESESLSKVIKIKPNTKEHLINISLNQERMSVQALMSMLYERYNGYLVDLWNKIIQNEKSNKGNKKYCYSTVRNIIRNRRGDYTGYKHITHTKTHLNYDGTIDFSLRSGDYNDGKKILKMLVNYGYNTVGFDSNKNKIIVTVNGNISHEDKENLIESIKGRLEENAINYFENAFLTNVTKRKFKTSSLHKSLESEKNITIDDFYNAFKEMFNEISENIERYEVYVR